MNFSIAPMQTGSERALRCRPLADLSCGQTRPQISGMLLVERESAAASRKRPSAARPSHSGIRLLTGRSWAQAAPGNQCSGSPVPAPIPRRTDRRFRRSRKSARRRGVSAALRVRCNASYASSASSQFLVPSCWNIGTPLHLHLRIDCEILLIFCLLVRPANERAVNCNARLGGLP